MRRRWRQFSANPASNRTLAFIAAGLAGLFAFTGALLRAHLERGTPGHSAALLPNLFALLSCIAAAVYQGRYADMLADAFPEAIKRGGVLRLLIGLLVVLPGCLMASTISSDAVQGVIRAAAYGLLAVGFAVLFSGLAQLAMSSGANYAATKVQERLDDDY